MGGKLLKHLGVGRISAHEYGQRMKRFDEIAEKIHNDNQDLEFMYQFPMPIKGKEDFGDLDVIFYATYPEKLINCLMEEVNSKGSAKNGQCTSFEWEGLQVDMLYASLENFNWQENWYSHGDSSSLLGRVYRYYNFKFGHDGLYFNVRTKNFSKDIFITADWVSAHKILEYKPLASFYMYSPEEVYEHVLTSPYAGKFVFEKMKPDRPRDMQVSFYDFTQSLEDVAPISQNKGWHLLYKYDKITFLKAAFLLVKLQFSELYNPVKKVVRKFYYTKVRPLFKEEKRGKKNGLRK